MSTTTPAPISSLTAANTEPTIVETIEEAQFILEENPDAAVLIRPKCELIRFCKASKGRIGPHLSI